MFLMWYHLNQISVKYFWIYHSIICVSQIAVILFNLTRWNKTDGTYRSTQLCNIGSSMDFQETTPEARLNHLIKEAGFTSIINIHETYYKCFSCHGIQNQWHLLTTHGKYMHSIFRVAHTSQIGKLKFFLIKTSYNETPTNRLDTTYLPIFTTTNTVFQ